MVSVERILCTSLPFQRLPFFHCHLNEIESYNGMFGSDLVQKDGHTAFADVFPAEFGLFVLRKDSQNKLLIRYIQFCNLKASLKRNQRLHGSGPLVSL